MMVGLHSMRIARVKKGTIIKQIPTEADVKYITSNSGSFLFCCFCCCSSVIVVAADVFDMRMY